MLARRRGVRRLRDARRVHGADGRHAHLRGARDRPRRERRPDAGELHVDDQRAARHDGSRDDDPDRPDRPDDDRHRRDASRSPPTSPSPRSSARSTASRSPSASRRRSTRTSRPATTPSACARPTSRATSTTTPATLRRGRSWRRPRRRSPRRRRRPAASASATFQFSSDQTGVTFFCSLDGLEATLCSSPKTYNGLPDGEHTFEVTARNSLGAVDETPAEHVWTVAVPPETTITDDAGQPDHVHERHVHVHRHRRRPDVRVLARRRRVRRVRHAGAVQRPDGRLAHVRGPRRRRARATSTRRRPGSPGRSATARAPETTIGAGAPAATTNNVNATFNFTAERGGLDVRRARSTTARTSPAPRRGSTPDLAAGPHVFRVRATDAAGNTDQSPATHTWTHRHRRSGHDDRLGRARRDDH